MSILELIARRSKVDASEFSLPDLLAEQAIARLPKFQDQSIHHLIVEYFSAALVRDDIADAQSYVDTLLAHGVGLDRLLFDFFAATAEYLGKCWEDDTLSFTQVTQGMGNLMLLTRDLTASPPVKVREEGLRPRVLLVRCPGEDHFFGMMLAGYRMRTFGWLVRLDFSGDTDEIAAAAMEQRFDVIGLTLSNKERIAQARKCIGSLRKIAPACLYGVGGGLVKADPSITARIGADLAINDVDGVLAALATRSSDPVT